MTLAYGSIYQLFFTDFKRDPRDETISINACIVTPANIDFDGDELYFLFIFEKEMRDAFTAIHPSQLMFSTGTPGMSSRIKLLDQNYVMLESFLLEDPDSEYYEEV